MSLIQIVRIVATAVAVLAVIPQIGDAIGLNHIATALVILGLIIGAIGVEADRQTAFLITAVALVAVHQSLAGIPVVGGYVTSILSNASVVFNAGAVAIIVMGIKDRVMES